MIKEAQDGPQNNEISPAHQWWLSFNLALELRRHWWGKRTKQPGDTLIRIINQGTWRRNEDCTSILEDYCKQIMKAMRWERNSSKRYPILDYFPGKYENTTMSCRIGWDYDCETMMSNKSFDTLPMMESLSELWVRDYDYDYFWAK